MSPIQFIFQVDLAMLTHSNMDYEYELLNKPK